MSHDDDPKRQVYEAEGPLDELPRLRQVLARMHPPAGAEAAVALRLRSSVGRATLPKRSSRKRGAFTFAALAIVSVPGLVAAHPDSRHWLRQFAGSIVAAMPFAHEPRAESAHAGHAVDSPAAADPKTTSLPPSSVLELGTAPPIQTADLAPSRATGPEPAAVASSSAASDRSAVNGPGNAEPARGIRSLNGRPEPPSSAPPSVPFPATIDDTAGTTANSTLAAERELLERAQALCVQGDATSALALIEQHARRFPNGALVPERLALRARAQSQLGSRGEVTNEHK